MRDESDRPSTGNVLRLMRPPRRHRQVVAYVVALVGVVGLVVVFLPFRDEIDPLSKGFGFLLVVVAAAGIGGIGPGVVASVFGFAVFNFFFIPPYETFVITEPEHVVVLFVFLGLSVLISILLGRADERAAAAESRETELRTLQDLSRELVVRGPGVDAYREIVSIVVSDVRLRVGGHVRPGCRRRPGPLGAGDGGRAVRRDPAGVGSALAGTAPRAAPALRSAPATSGSSSCRGRPTPLSGAESRILRAFGDQLALVLERDRLLRTATEAEVYRQTERLRQTLLAAVSHDLRSPLAAIKASVTDLLDEDVPHTSGARREALEAIDLESERLNALIANLLDMSRIEAGVLHARLETVDVGDAVSSSVRNVARVWPQIRVRSLVGDGIMVRADPVFLDRVLTNLLENAARSAQGGDPGIEITSGTSNGRVTIRVVDHGAGVTPDNREVMFHPFYELDQRNPRLGAGLGLAIAKGFVVAMDGEIWIEDTPGGGATFAVAVPKDVGGSS